MANPLVHVIDDDEAVRVSLAFLLEMNDFEPRTYPSAEAFLESLGDAPAGCVVTDVRMPEMSGLDLVRVLQARGVALPVIVITGHGDVPMAVEAMRAGVRDFIEKPFTDDSLVASIRTALGSTTPTAAEHQAKVAFSALLSSLSGRERDVLNGIVAGKMNKVIAFELGISPRTVEVYRANVMSKTQAKSLSDLVRIGLLAGL